LPASRRLRAACRWMCCSWMTVPATPPPRSAATTARASIRLRTHEDSAPRYAPASRSPVTRAMPQRSTSTATASTTQQGSSRCSNRSRAGAPTMCSARASSATARACRGIARWRTARRARSLEPCSARSRPMPRPAAAGSPPARSPPRASGTTTTTHRCSASPCGAPASTRWRSRSATGAARAGARSCATPSTSREWHPRCGASGAPPAPRAGRAAGLRLLPRPPARTASRRRARTAAARR
jgi:hypothetical protein